MDLLDYHRVLARHWVTLFVLAVLGTGAGALLTQTAAPEFRATSTLFLSLDEETRKGQLSHGGAFAQARVRSYAMVAMSHVVTKEVVKRLRLDMTPKQLKDKIRATSRPDAVLIQLTVTDTRRKRVASITNAVAERFAEAIRELENPPGVKHSPLKLTIIEPALVPAAPVSPRPAVNLTLGLFAGLVLGACLAVLRESRDRSVRSPEELAGFLTEVGGPPVLGAVARDPRTSSLPVAVRDDTHGLRAEGFRRLSTNLRFTGVDRAPKVIAVTSPLPADGKSSVAVNLAATLAESGSSVCLVETDLRRPSAARTLGLVRDAGLTTVLIGQAEAHQVLQAAGSISVLTSGSIPPNPSELLGSTQLRDLLRTLAGKFDHVVVDTAPVLPVADATVIAPAVDGYLVVVRASRTSRNRVGETLRALERVGAPLLGMVLNEVPPRMDAGALGHAYLSLPHPGGRLRRLRGLVRGGPARTVPQSRQEQEHEGPLCSVTTEGNAKQ